MLWIFLVETGGWDGTHALHSGEASSIQRALLILSSVEILRPSQIFTLLWTSFEFEETIIKSGRRKSNLPNL